MSNTKWQRVAPGYYTRDGWKIVRNENGRWILVSPSDYPSDSDDTLTEAKAHYETVLMGARNEGGPRRVTIEWEDASASSYTAESTTINGHAVTVCLDDEGPLRPAFYWDIDDRTVDGWASTVHLARREAVRTARSMT